MYGTRSNGNQHGVVFTKEIVVKAMLDLVDFISSIDLSKIRIVEPAAGKGVFSLEIIRRLYKSSVNFGFSFQDALHNLAFFEIDKAKSSELLDNINILLNEYGLKTDYKLVLEEDFLLADIEKCDIIIGNPPYVRNECIPPHLKERYQKLFGSFRHRSDLYILFFEKGLVSLKQHGQLCYICSNRWLKNQYGKSLRNLIKSRYQLTNIIDLEQTNPFQESVTAYPSIITIINSNDRINTNYYELQDLDSLTSIASNKIHPLKTLRINNTNWFENELIEGNSYSHLDFIENQGFKIGIGVATGNDKVFIRSDFNDEVENQLLIPIITTKDLKGDKFHWHGNYIINPYTKEGELIVLNNYPKAKTYFYKHEEILKKRHTAINNPDKWYKTIDRIEIGLINKP